MKRDAASLAVPRSGVRNYVRRFEAAARTNLRERELTDPARELLVQASTAALCR
jgi:hypothetical protein